MTLEELQQRFLTGLAKRLSDLSVLVEGTADPEQLMRSFHSLAGIAGTYGYDPITEISREFESMCLMVIDEQRALTGLERARVSEAIEAVRRHAIPASPK